MKRSISVVAALVFGVAVLGAQDKKKEPTGVDKVCDAIHKECCKAEKCEGEQKKVCGNVGATIKAGLGEAGAKMKKEGMKCEGCEKAKEAAPCDACRELLVKTLTPWVKTQAGAKDATHTVTQGDKKETVKCTLLAGPACKGCADEMSTAIVKACKEAQKK